MVLMGVKYSTSENPTFYFNRFHAETGAVRHEDHNWINGGPSTKFVKAENEAGKKALDAMFSNAKLSSDRYEVLAFTLAPGHWVLTKKVSVESRGNTITNYVTSFSFSTIAFEVKAGQVVYLGDYELRGSGSGRPLGNGLSRIESNPDAATKKLEQFPNVRVDMDTAIPVPATFTCGEAKSLVGIKTGGCKPMVVTLAYDLNTTDAVN